MDKGNPRGYAPSRRGQFMFFGAVFVVAALLVAGYVGALSAFDQPAGESPDATPWSQTSGLIAPDGGRQGTSPPQ